MPGKPPTRVAPRDQMVDHHSDSDDAKERRMDEIARQVATYPSKHRARITADLIVGTNRLVHNLGRKPQHVTLMPTTADATFAWCVTSMDDKQVTITVVGVAQTDASIEVV